MKPDDSRIVLEIQEAARAKARAASRPNSKVQAEEALQIVAEAGGNGPLAPIVTHHALSRMSRSSVPNSGAAFDEQQPGAPVAPDCGAWLLRCFVLDARWHAN